MCPNRHSWSVSTPACPLPQLRREVGELRGRERRRVFEPAVSVGVPAGARESFLVRTSDRSVVDTALRTDVVADLVERTPDDCRFAWITRSGVPELHDLDLAWLAAAELAFGIHGRPLAGFFAVTRSGWLDVRTGLRRTWRRLRL